MKYNNTHFMQVSRKLFKYSFEELPAYSRYIFFVMNELEQRYTKDNADYFYRSDKQLAEDCGVSKSTIERYKKPLIDLGIVQHFKIKLDCGDGKKSKESFSAYKILL